jgi:hypothetical protein
MATFNVTRDDVKTAIASEEAKLQSAQGQHQELLGANWFGCTACKAGLNVTLAAPLAAALVLAPEALAASAVVAVIAEATGLSIAVVTGALSGLIAGGAASIEEAISKLCELMGACD